MFFVKRIFTLLLGGVLVLIVFGIFNSAAVGVGELERKGLKEEAASLWLVMAFALFSLFYFICRYG